MELPNFLLVLLTDELLKSKNATAKLSMIFTKIRVAVQNQKNGKVDSNKLLNQIMKYLLKH